MAATWTQADVDALKLAIKSGTRRVRYKDREVEYHSMKEMLSLLTAMQQDVANEAGTPPYRFMGTSKGFDRGSCDE